MAFSGMNLSKGKMNKSTTGKIDEAKLNHMIKERAYYIWESKGKPRGQDFNIWVQAEKEMIAKVK